MGTLKVILQQMVMQILSAEKTSASDWDLEPEIRVMTVVPLVGPICKLQIAQRDVE